MKILFIIISFILLNNFAFSQENCNSSRAKYLETYPDVKKVGVDPWNHYLTFGKNEKRVWSPCEILKETSAKQVGFI